MNDAQIIRDLERIEREERQAALREKAEMAEADAVDNWIDQQLEDMTLDELAESFTYGKAGEE